MPSEPTKRKFRQPSRRAASSPVAKKAKDALSVPAEKSRDATSTTYSKVQAVPSEVDRKIQEAKKFAVSQAQRDHSMGNYRIIDSPFGNFLIPVIPTRAELGTVYTRLVAPAYAAVRDEFRKRVGNLTTTSLGGFDTCYSVPIIAPTVTFMFSSMNVTLPEDNILIHGTTGGITCLAMVASAIGVSSELNVIANMQQQNHRVLIDVPNSRLGVAREQCS